MKPELKLGRRCIAWSDEDPTEHKGVYIYDDGGSEVNYAVLNDDGTVINYFDHVKIDPTAEPMNGDEVEWKHYSGKWANGTAKYIGQKSDGTHLIEEECGNVLTCTEVRFPQQSKRDRILEAIRSWQESSKVPMYDDLADLILKIMEEEL